MSNEPVRIVHYINQFFGGIGGEEKAGTPPLAKDGPVGPGAALQAALGERGKVVGTVICGDNYFSENTDQAVARVSELIRAYQPDVVVSGPAFNSGRYGMACGRVSQIAVEELHVPAVTGMFIENPGIELYRKWAYIVPTAAASTGMRQAVSKMGELANRLGSGQVLGSAEEEGYVPQGYRRNKLTDKSAAERAAEMLLAKVLGQPYKTEVPLPTFDKVVAPKLTRPLNEATIALVTEGGIVPLGNPDRLETGWALHWFRYDISQLDNLTSATHMSIHGGYDTYFANQDPDRVVPLDAVRNLERQGKIGRVYPQYFVTAGTAAPVANAAKVGREIGKELKDAGVDAVLLVAT